MGYGQQQEESEDSDKENEVEGWDSDDVDPGEMAGLEGMIYQSLELLATLVQRPNVQQLILQGIVPLTTTVCSYLIIPLRQEHCHKHDLTYFLAQDSWHVVSIRNKCLQLISSLIEAFNEDAIEALLLFVQNICINVQPKPVEAEKSKVEEEEEGGENQDFQKMLQELVYVSQHKKHQAKRREVGMLLIGQFADDISMYAIRNEKFYLMTLVGNIVLPQV